MKEFMSLREFLLLKDDTDTYKRPIHRNGCYMPYERGKPILSALEDAVSRYDQAKLSWEEFGQEGPPVGSEVETLYGGYGSGGSGAIRIFSGVYSQDNRFFFLISSKDRQSKFLVHRKTWFCHIRLYKEEK